MGLFDNLFLDQNTPVTINDGIDHSKDVTTPVIPPGNPKDPYPHGGVTGGITGDDKKDSSVADLFEADKKEEMKAEKILHPDNNDDIALEIGHGPVVGKSMPPADPSIVESNVPNSDIPVTFDIGGDISFDIGGDIPGNAPSQVDGSSVVSDSSVSATKETVHSEGAGLSGTFLGAGEVPATSDISPNGPETNTEDQKIITQELEEEKAGETIPDVTQKIEEAPLGAIVGSSSSTGTAVLQDVIAIPGDNTLFNLLGEAPEPEKKNEASSEKSEASLPSALEGGGDVSMGQEGAESPLSLLVGAVPSSPLREKLFSYVDELKSIQMHEQTQKNHKLQQIEVLEERIREIDLEAAARKKVIKREIDMLHREIEAMDQDESEIGGVVSSFEKELGTV